MEDREEQERDRYWSTENRDEERDGEQRAEIDGEDEHQEPDNILEHAIEYCMKGSYPLGLTKDKKRAVRKRARAVTVENGEVFVQRRKKKVCTLLLLAFHVECQFKTYLTCNFPGEIGSFC